MIRLTDGRSFRRTRRDINLDNSPSAGFGIAQQSNGVAEPSSSVCGYRAPASAGNLLPVLSWTPPIPPVLTVNRQAASSVLAAINQPPPVPPGPLVLLLPQRSSRRILNHRLHAIKLFASRVLPKSGQRVHAVVPGWQRSVRPFRQSKDGPSR